jgi:hypothetical protein
VGLTLTMDDAPIVREIRGLIGGELTEDEAALVRTLTPTALSGKALAEHRVELVGLLDTIRSDEAMADYVFAIAPNWDSSIESLLLGGRVTNLFANLQIERSVLAAAAA